MKILMTGHDGYIGAVMTPLLTEAGHEVVGLDSAYFAGCDFGPYLIEVAAKKKDLRDIDETDLTGFDAVIHLAALSNDPLGNINPESTYAINHRASVRLAELAKAAGVARFVYSSSCSVYGAASPEDVLDELAAFSPVTPYAESKVRVEADVAKMADERFTPIFMRNATVYGVSPKLRGDLVVNNLVGWAMTTGQVHLKSDGTPWRPLVHVRDLCEAFRCVLRAPREAVHNQAFNVGRSAENYRISDVAEIVAKVVPNSRITYAEGAGPDPRCYRVDFTKIESLEGFAPSWTVERGVHELHDAYRQIGLTVDDLEGDRYLRIKRIRGLVESGRLDTDLRWSPARTASAGR